MASTASSTDVGRDALLTTLSDLPNEVLTKILARTVASKVPFHLDGFIQLGKVYQKLPSQMTKGLSLAVFLRALPSSQKEHYLDWLLVNGTGTSRRVRACGKLAFFSEKIFMISPRLLKTLQDGSCRNVSAPDKAAVLSHVQHVVAPLPTADLACRFSRLSPYNAFTRIRVLSIEPQFLDGCNRVYCQALETASAPIPLQPLLEDEPDSTFPKGIPKRHSAPQELLSLLEDVGLQVGRMEVDLILCDTEDSRQWAIVELSSRIYPYLQIIGMLMPKTRSAHGQKSPAPV